MVGVFGGRVRSPETMIHPGYDPDQIFLYRDVVDFRKSIDGLASIVELELGMTIFLRRSLFSRIAIGTRSRFYIGVGMDFVFGTSDLRRRDLLG